MLGVKVATLGTWERGKYPFSFYDACRIADILECTLDELAGRSVCHSAYSDPRQAQLNRDFESLDDSGKSAAVGAVAGIASMQATGEAGETRPVTDKRWA